MRVEGNHNRWSEDSVAFVAQDGDASGKAAGKTKVADREIVQVALEQLTEDQRQLIALRYFADATTAEIAATMAKSEPAVYSLEVRALAALRRAMSPVAAPGSDVA